MPEQARALPDRALGQFASPSMKPLVRHKAGSCGSCRMAATAERYRRNVPASGDVLLLQSRNG